MQTVKMNAKLRDFRENAYYDIDKKQKELEVTLSFD